MSCNKISLQLEGVLKCAICREIVNQPKTLTCLHSFCSKCIAQLPRTAAEGNSGIRCPLCNAFSEKSCVKSSFLLKELLHMHSKLQDNDNMCQQCSKNEAKWNCLDDRMALCDVCKVNHLKIPACKHHRIVEGSAADEMVVDGLVFCTLHPDKLVEFSCEECDVPLCIKCKVTQHDYHNTETIEDTLGRILPVVKKNKAKLEEIMTTFDQQCVDIVSKIDEVKEAFTKCRDEAVNNRNEVIERAKTQHDWLVKQLNMKQEEVLTKLEIARSEAETNIKQYKQVCDWVDTSIESARGVTLMTEMQAGLYTKVAKMINPETTKPISVQIPELKANNAQQEMTDMIGHLRYTSSKLSSEYTEDISNIVHSFDEVFAKQLKPGPVIKLQGYPTRMAKVNSDIWIPGRERNIIYVVNQDDQIVRDIPYTNCPRSVTQTTNGDIMVASDAGLHIVDEYGSNITQLLTGRFCDVRVTRVTMAALQYNTQMIHVYKHSDVSPINWVKETQFSLKSQSVSCYSTILCCNSLIYVSLAVHDSTIYQYTTKGQFVKQCSIKDVSNISWICDRDDQSNVLIADQTNNCLQLLQKDGGSHRINVPDLSGPRDVICHRNTVWILCHYQNQLRKYTVT